MAKIIVIEDAKTESLVISRILTNRGHTVLSAEDGAEGLSLVQKELPDLVLSDIVMPKMDGFQVCRKVKRGSTTSHIPVVLISSKSEDTDKFWGMKQGASDYLNKPISEEALLASVNSALK